jgi:hypothetical protein
MPGQIADNALPFSVWRETRQLPRRRLAAFRNEIEAMAFAEYRARIEGENYADIDTTIWVPVCEDAERLHKTYPAAIKARKA